MDGQIPAVFVAGAISARYPFTGQHTIPSLSVFAPPPPDTYVVRTGAFQRITGLG